MHVCIHLSLSMHIYVYIYIYIYIYITIISKIHGCCLNNILPEEVKFKGLLEIQWLSEIIVGQNPHARHMSGGLRIARRAPRPRRLRLRRQHPT